MAIHDLKGQIARLPEQPGVYLFLGASGETLYVGKARVLRDRVRSYLAAWGHSPRIDALLSDAAALEVIVTDSVVEALALENRLIKQRNPRFNVLLRDDKTYPYLQLTTTERAPRLLVARRVERDGNVYAGPFMPASVARRTMSLSHRLFGIRSCNEIIDGQRGRPCLEYDIKRCLAPCVERVLQPRALPARSRADPLPARGAPAGAGGRAARPRCRTPPRSRRSSGRRICAMPSARSRRSGTGATASRRPPWATATLSASSSGRPAPSIQVFQVRRGRVDRPHRAGLRRAPRRRATTRCRTTADAAALVATALQQFYADRPAPPEVHVPVDLDPDDRAAIEAWLAEAGRPPRARRRAAAGRQAGSARSGVAQCRRSPTRPHFGEGATAAFEALDTLRVLLACRRCRGASSASTSRRSRAARPWRRWWWPSRAGCGAASTASSASRASPCGPQAPGGRGRGPGRSPASSSTTSPRCTRSSCGGIGGCSSRAGRSRISIVDRRRQGAARRPPTRRCADLGLERLVAVGLAKQEELIFTRDRAEGIALAARRRRPPPAAADPGRGPPVRRDVPPSRPHHARPAVRPRRHRRAWGPGAAASCSRRSVRSPASAAPAARTWSRWSGARWPTP